MRDESNVVIVFTARLEVRLHRHLHPPLIEFLAVELRSFSRATLRHQKIIRSCPPSPNVDVSTRIILHILAGVSLMGSQILIEWSVP